MRRSLQVSSVRPLHGSRTRRTKRTRSTEVRSRLQRRSRTVSGGAPAPWIPSVETVHRFSAARHSGLGPEVWRVLSKCHDMRNRTEYEGALDVDERLVADLITACRKVAAKIKALPPIPAKPT